MQAVNNTLESAMSNSNKPVTLTLLQKVASQSMLNGALVIAMAADTSKLYSIHTPFERIKFY